MKKRLSEPKPGEQATVLKVEGDRPIHRRVLDMGLFNGSEVLVRRRAPLGDTTEFVVQGSSLSLRKAQADAVLVETE